MLSLAPKKDKEANVETPVCQHAVKLEWICKKFSSPSNRAEPDRLFLKESQAVFIEFKKRGKEPTQLQMDKLWEKVDAGFIACWCDDVEAGKTFFDADCPWDFIDVETLRLL